ncbi:aminoacyl-tRNA hydrolase [bacterium]|nr:MAG: aminoacyl-tRNA hydrolase [bacterium]
MIRISEEIELGEEELSEKYIRSSGPGGQNVNKVATAVQLRFNALLSPNLSDYVRLRLLKLAGSRATLEGEIIIEADRFRTREQNRADALERLKELIIAAAKRPKRRVKTKPTKASKERRIEAKKGRATVKRGRTKVRAEDS